MHTKYFKYSSNIASDFLGYLNYGQKLHLTLEFYILLNIYKGIKNASLYQKFL